MTAAPSPTHAAVSRPTRSPTMCSSGSSLNCSAASARYAPPAGGGAGPPGSAEVWRAGRPFNRRGARGGAPPAGEQPRPPGGDPRRYAIDGPLEQRAVAAEGEELLGPPLPAARPEPRSAA